MVFSFSTSKTILFSISGQFFDISPEMSIVIEVPTHDLKVGINKLEVFPIPVPAVHKIEPSPSTEE